MDHNEFLIFFVGGWQAASEAAGQEASGDAQSLSCSTYKQDCNATRDECWKRQLGNWVRRRHWHRTLQLYSYWILKRKPFSSVALTSPEQMWQCLQANSGQQSGHWENIKKKKVLELRTSGKCLIFFCAKTDKRNWDQDGQTLGI